MSFTPCRAPCGDDTHVTQVVHGSHDERETTVSDRADRDEAVFKLRVSGIRPRDPIPVFEGGRRIFEADPVPSDISSILGFIPEWVGHGRTVSSGALLSLIRNDARTYRRNLVRWP
jgi:hypothetical protein